MIPVRSRLQSRVHEAVARNLDHGIQHQSIANPALLQLVADHLLTRTLERVHVPHLPPVFRQIALTR